MKKISMILLLCLTLVTTAYAEIFNIIYVSKKPTNITTYNKDSGKMVWRSRNTAATFKADGKSYIRIVEDGSGQYGNDKKYKTWRSESIYLYQNNTIIPQSSRLEFKDKDGVVVNLLSTVYDQKTKTVKCAMLNEKKEFELKEGMLDKNGLGVALENYPFERKNDFIFPMLTDEPAFYNMTLVNRGTEELTVNSRTIECYKIQMIPDLGFLGIFAPFVPKTYFWYKAAFPHDFVRYEGLESGLNTPYIVMKAED